MIALGAAVGFTAGILNPFNVGVAQDIAELPLFSGMAYRFVILIVLLVATSAYIIVYAKRWLLIQKKCNIWNRRR